MYPLRSPLIDSSCVTHYQVCQVSRDGGQTVFACNEPFSKYVPTCLSNKTFSYNVMYIVRKLHYVHVEPVHSLFNVNAGTYHFFFVLKIVSL